ncbi:uncharacterized protein LOC135319961 isoform X3 [Camelus dromedarius]|uniref:uncharacterized protein LOC135319961 isoform X3 n=1 Tax=Camelus dromedarius TaxID=9838 RepID=UPI0031196FF2
MFLALKERLQLDWVAWRLHVFYKRKKNKFIFIISWNEIEGKFVITCYNRMAQRQRSGTSGQVCLGHDLDTCGWKILSQEFFMETHDREYYEPLASCSRRTRKRIQEVPMPCESGAVSPGTERYRYAHATLSERSIHVVECVSELHSFSSLNNSPLFITSCGFWPAEVPPRRNKLLKTLWKSEESQRELGASSLSNLPNLLSTVKGGMQEFREGQGGITSHFTVPVAALASLHLHLILLGSSTKRAYV